MARDRIEYAPDLDGEWAFELMVRGLPSTVPAESGSPLRLSRTLTACTCD